MKGGREFRAVAAIGDERLDDRAIRDAELERARHALAYLKGKLGNDAMRRLLDDDLRAMAAQVRGWVDASGAHGKAGRCT